MRPASVEAVDHLAELGHHLGGGKSLGVAPFLNIYDKRKIEHNSVDGAQKILRLAESRSVEAEKVICPGAQPLAACRLDVHYKLLVAERHALACLARTNDTVSAATRA